MGGFPDQRGVKILRNSRRISPADRESVGFRERLYCHLEKPADRFLRNCFGRLDQLRDGMRILADHCGADSCLSLGYCCEVADLLLFQHTGQEFAGDAARELQDERIGFSPGFCRPGEIDSLAGRGAFRFCRPVDFSPLQGWEYQCFLPCRIESGNEYFLHSFPISFLCFF